MLDHDRRHPRHVKQIAQRLERSLPSRRAEVNPPSYPESEGAFRLAPRSAGERRGQGCTLRAWLQNLSSR